MGRSMFFELEDGNKVNSTIYRDQILKGSLQEFWEESFGDLEVPIVMEDNAPPHKKVSISVREELGMKCHQHPPNSPDLNPIENIWAHMKGEIMIAFVVTNRRCHGQKRLVNVCLQEMVFVIAMNRLHP